MKKILKTTFVLVSILCLMSCSSDDNGGSPSAEFTLDGETYKVNQGVIQVFNDASTGIANAAITLMGSNGGKSGNVSFQVVYNINDSIEGTYVSDENSWDEIVGTYSSWLSTYSIAENNDMTHSNEPVGPVKMISHGDNQYTLEFDVTFFDNVSASGSVKTKFIIQNMNFDFD